MSHAIKVLTAANIVGRFKLIEVTKPAIIGGIAWASDIIDWFMPKISPCLSFSAKLEIIAVLFGWVSPWNIAIKGIIK